MMKRILGRSSTEETPQLRYKNVSPAKAADLKINLHPEISVFFLILVLLDHSRQST
jgi:hypothetical protein